MDEYDIEQLISLAKQPPSKLEEKIAELSKKELTDAHKFCLAKNISSGTTKISFAQIYYLYQQWAGDAPIGTVAFGKQFAKLFKRHRDQASSFYLLDPTPFGVSVEQGSKKEVKKVTD